MRAHAAARQPGVVDEQQLLSHTCSRIASAMPSRRDCAIAQSRFDDRARHAVDDARLFGLGEDRPALGLDPGRALAAVLAHAGHDDAEHAAAVDLGRRLKQHVDRRAVRRVERPHSRWVTTCPCRCAAATGGGRPARSDTVRRSTSSPSDASHDLQRATSRRASARTVRCSRPACAGRSRPAPAIRRQLRNQR